MEQKLTNKQKIILVIGSIAIIAAVYYCVRYLFGIFAPFIIGFLIALWIERPVNFLASKIGGRKSIWAVIITILLTSVIVGVLGYILYLGLMEIKAFIINYEYCVFVVRQAASKICTNLDGWLGLYNGCCEGLVLKGVAFIKRADFSGSFGNIAKSVLTFSIPAAVNIIKIIGAVIVMLMSVVYATGVLNKLRGWCITSVFRPEIEVVKKSLTALVNVYFKVQGLIMLINIVVCVVGLVIIKNPYAVIIGILIGIIDALPIFGSGTVLLPWALIMLLMKNVFSAAVLATIYIVTYFVREIMEAKYVGNSLGIAPFTMFIVIFTGLMVYGLMGFILGPVSYCVIKPLILHLKTTIERGKLG